MSVLPWYDVFYSNQPLLTHSTGLGLTEDDLVSLFSLPKSLSSLCPNFQPLVEGNPDQGWFQANIDVQQFAPQDISVTLSGDTITIEAKHDNRQDDHGFIARQFIRRYIVPKGHDLTKLQSKLTSDGVLTITAPKLSENVDGDRKISIIETGRPFKCIETKDDEK